MNNEIQSESGNDYYREHYLENRVHKHPPSKCQGDCQECCDIHHMQYLVKKWTKIYVENVELKSRISLLENENKKLNEDAVRLESRNVEFRKLMEQLKERLQVDPFVNKHYIDLINKVLSNDSEELTISKLKYYDDFIVNMGSLDDSIVKSITAKLEVAGDLARCVEKSIEGNPATVAFIIALEKWNELK